VGWCNKEVESNKRREKRFTDQSSNDDQSLTEIEAGDLSSKAHLYLRNLSVDNIFIIINLRDSMTTATQGSRVDRPRRSRSLHFDPNPFKSESDFEVASEKRHQA